MKIFLDNVNLNSHSGPNGFGKKLMSEIESEGIHKFTASDPDVQLSFITSTKKLAPLALRLDGIYFNTRQDWEANNRPIKKSFDESDLVIYQTEFNRRLTEMYFGIPRKSVVIGNGTCLKTIASKSPLTSETLDRFGEVWSCSSSWRPHKRLRENVRYFLEHSPRDACLVVAGNNPDYRINDPRVLYAGHMSWDNCIALYKRSKVFLHLAFLDHCPNVVVDARASGCRVVVASSGGTREISGPDSIVIEDIEWDLRPLDLYDPPPLDFTTSYVNNITSSIDIKETAAKYTRSLIEISRQK